MATNAALYGAKRDEAQADFVCYRARGFRTSGCARSPQAKEARFMRRAKEATNKKDCIRASLELLNAVKVMPRDVEAY